MLENVPHGLGRALRDVRAGFDKIVSEDDAFADVAVIALRSPAFPTVGTIPARYTADGEGLSPPLAWHGPIEDAASLVLIVEDPDAPTPEPLAHLIAWDLPPDLSELPEGRFKSPGHDGLEEGIGRNSFFQTGWLPPDPPPGHGMHLYVFQLFALDRRLELQGAPSRAKVVEAMKGRVLARGVLVGTYERP